MNILYFFYNLSQSEKFGKIHGFGRIKRFMKEIFRNRYLKMPYLEGSIWACPNHAMGIDVFKTGVYEPLVIDLIRHFVRAGFSFVDIGANIGLHTLAAAHVRVSEHQSFHSFEPEPSAFSLLMRNCTTNKFFFVHCYQEALGAMEGQLPLYVATDKNKGRNSLIQRERTVEGPKVPVRKFDSVFGSDHSILTHPLLVKVDVEGYESEVLSGGQTSLSQLTELGIICEIELGSDFNLHGNSALTLMEKIGMVKSYVTLDPDTVNDRKLKWPAVNMIFIKGSLALEQIEPFVSKGLLIPSSDLILQ